MQWTVMRCGEDRASIIVGIQKNRSGGLSKVCVQGDYKIKVTVRNAKGAKVNG